MRGIHLIIPGTVILILMFGQRLSAQHILEDTRPFAYIYDTFETGKLPPVALYSGKFKSGYDSVFSGFYDLKSGHEYLSSAYPNPAFSNLNYRRVKRYRFFSGKNNYRPPATGHRSYASVVYITDSLLRITDRAVIFNEHYRYLYHGHLLSGVIAIDPHDIQIVQRDGKKYAFLIGFRTELSDENALMGADSVMIRYSTIHIIDVATRKELARFEPMEQGFPLKPFYLVKNLNRTSKPYRYSHPHINVIEPRATPDGWEIFFSSRDPGIIGKLEWNGKGKIMKLRWIFGSKPVSPVSAWIPSVSSNVLACCHGSGAMYKGDTLYIATFNNNPCFNWPPQSSSRFQVYRVLADTATLIWQSPDAQVNFGNRGRATWHGDKLLCAEGQNGGLMAGYDWETKKYKYSQNYDRLQVWQPFSNKIIVALKLPGDVAYADWVDSLPALPAALIALTGDSMVLTYPDTSLNGLDNFQHANQKYQT